MMPRYALEAFDRLLREIHQNDLPFGGRMMILGGDFRFVNLLQVIGKHWVLDSACPSRRTR